MYITIYLPKVSLNIGQYASELIFYSFNNFCSYILPFKIDYYFIKEIMQPIWNNLHCCTLLYSNYTLNKGTVTVERPTILSMFYT